MPRQRFPRQSAASSGGALTATSISSDVTTPGTSITPSGSASASGVTSGPSSSPTSPAIQSSTPSSQSTGPSTTTSGSTGTTSTSQSTSSSQTISLVVLNTSTFTSTSSSSSNSPSTTSSTDSPSSSVPSPTTTQPPTTSSSQQETVTTITSSYTTYINGTPVPTQTTFPSTIPVQLASSSSSNRAAIIGGSAAGGTAVLILLLTLAFCVRRKRFKRLDFLDAITLKRKQIRSRADLLDGEDMVDIDPQRPPLRYTDYETPWDASHSRDGSDRALMAGRVTPGTPGTQHTLTGPPRWSETGSAFKEDIWPPPHEGTQLIDPLAHKDDLDLDLSRIVDDVMGPSSTAAHFSDRSVSSMYRDSVAVSEGAVHSRTASNASNAALLDAAALGGAVSPSTAPVRSSPLAQPVTKSGPVEPGGGNAS